MLKKAHGGIRVTPMGFGYGRGTLNPTSLSDAAAHSGSPAQPLNPAGGLQPPGDLATVPIDDGLPLHKRTQSQSGRDPKRALHRSHATVAPHSSVEVDS